MNRAIFLLLLPVFVFISCKQKPSKVFVPDPKTAIYVDDSDNYYELLNLYDDTIVSDSNFKKKDLPIEVILEVANRMGIDTNKIAENGKASCQCVGYQPGIEFIALDRNKQKGFVEFCEGTEVSWRTLLYFNLSSKYNNLTIFKIYYHGYLPFDNDLNKFFTLILNRNIIVGVYSKIY